ncbi:MAG: hypothetical protein U1E33_07715 [Rhodospirillales bacterium]
MSTADSTPLAAAQGRERRERPQGRPIQAISIVDQHRRHLLVIAEVLKNSRDKERIGRAPPEDVAAGRNDVAEISRRGAIDEGRGMQQPHPVQCRNFVAQVP